MATVELLAEKNRAGNQSDLVSNTTHLGVYARTQSNFCSACAIGTYTHHGSSLMTRSANLYEKSATVFYEVY